MGIENRRIVSARPHPRREGEAHGEPEAPREPSHWILIVAATEGTPDVSTMKSM